MTLPQVLHFVTSNPHKASEVEALLGSSVRRVDANPIEIQARTLEAILLAKLEVVKSAGPLPIAVEDVSLELTALGGFPGPYVKWLLQSAGGEGLAAITSALEDRTAVARCMIGYWDGARVVTAEGRVTGSIVESPRGSREFGWDAWFQPQGLATTYGEMTGDEKSRISHRALAWRKLREELSSAARTPDGG